MTELQYVLEGFERRLSELKNKRIILHGSRDYARSILERYRHDFCFVGIMSREPTDGIDAVTRQDVLQLMVDEVAENNTTILITSHRLEDIERMCNRIGFLEDNTLSNIMDLDELKGDFIKIQMAF